MAGLEAGDRVRYTGRTTALAGRVGKLVYLDREGSASVRWDHRPGLMLVALRFLAPEQEQEEAP